MQPKLFIKVALLSAALFSAPNIAEAQLSDTIFSLTDREPKVDIYVDDDLFASIWDKRGHSMFDEICSRIDIREWDYGMDGCGGEGRYLIGWEHFGVGHVLPDWLTNSNCRLYFVKEVTDVCDLFSPDAVIGVGIGWSL